MPPTTPDCRKRGWYYAIKNGAGNMYSGRYIDKKVKEPAIAACIPLNVSGELAIIAKKKSDPLPITSTCHAPRQPPLPMPNANAAQSCPAKRGPPQCSQHLTATLQTLHCTGPEHAPSESYKGPLADENGLIGVSCTGLLLKDLSSYVKDIFPPAQVLNLSLAPSSTPLARL